MTFYLPPYIRNLVAYVPGKSVEETKREFKIKKIVKLASNENPLGPSPKALRAVTKALSSLNVYPDGSGFLLKEALARVNHTAASSLILGNGSNEVIDQLIRTFCVAGDSIVTPSASFIAYRICAQIHGVQTEEIPVDHMFQFDSEALVHAVKSNPKVKLVFIANPNNPTGTYVPSAKLKHLVKQLTLIRGGSVLTVLDAAYGEYATAKDLPDSLEMFRAHPGHVVVLKTFSKIYGLAGARLGYAIASPEIISLLEKVRQPFNINSLALCAGEAALSDVNYVKKSKIANTKGLQFWQNALNRLQIPYWESQGNFLLIDTISGLGLSGFDVYENCLRKGVIFRPVHNYGLSHALRISVGTPDENKVAVKVLADFVQRVRNH